MLVLTRQANEELVIDLSAVTYEEFTKLQNIPIVLKVVAAIGKVRLGAEAPKAVKIHRREVFDAIRRETQIRS